MTDTASGRRAYVRAVVTSAQRTGEPVTPWRSLGGLGAHFDGESDLLAELHREWVRVLVSRLHRHGIVADRSAASVGALYDEACADHPTLRRILDAHATEPALREPTHREHAMLARIAGLASDELPVSQAAAAGRALARPRPPSQHGPDRRWVGVS